MTAAVPDPPRGEGGDMTRNDHTIARPRTVVLFSKMSEREYGAYTHILGYEAVMVNGVVWNQVRPFFPVHFYRFENICRTPFIPRKPRSSEDFNMPCLSAFRLIHT